MMRNKNILTAVKFYLMNAIFRLPKFSLFIFLFQKFRQARVLLGLRLGLPAFAGNELDAIFLFVKLRLAQYFGGTLLRLLLKPGLLLLASEKEVNI